MFRVPRLVLRGAAFSTAAHRSVDPRVVFEVRHTATDDQESEKTENILLIMIFFDFFFFFSSQATKRGDGVLVDLRPSHDGFLLTKETVRYPYDLILGSKEKKTKEKNQREKKKKVVFFSHTYVYLLR
jgi:hypothetical protein